MIPIPSLQLHFAVLAKVMELEVLATLIPQAVMVEMVQEAQLSFTTVAPMMTLLPIHTMTLALNGMMPTQELAVNTTLTLSFLPITVAPAWVMDGMDLVTAMDMAMASATTLMVVAKVVKEEMVVPLSLPQSSTMAAPMMIPLLTRTMTLALSGTMKTQVLAVITTLILSFLPITVALAWVMDGMDLAIVTDMATASVTTLMAEAKVVKEEMVVPLSLLPSSTMAAPMTIP
jgi:hypothetical protein